MQRIKEIGSNFWLRQEDISDKRHCTITPDLFNCHGSDYVWLSSGRSAISFIIDTIEQRNPSVNKRVCVPAFTCHTVFEPFLNAGYEVHSLPVETDLRSDAGRVLETIVRINPGIVVFHRYFGFDTLPDISQLVSDIKRLGIIVIEDVTQCLYSSFQRLDADYYIASIRKWCGVPDGSFAVCTEGHFRTKPETSDTELEKAKIEASLMKCRYIEKGIGDKSEFLRKYRDAEDILISRTEPHLISETSYRVQANLDKESMIEQRRSNYAYLLSHLSDIVGIEPILTNLDQESVPLYFPILCDKRSKLQQLLAENKIYAPVVWPKDSKCPEINNESEEVYNRILCLPIDQRYDIDDMSRIVKVITDNYIRISWLEWEQIAPFIEQITDWEQEVIIKYHYPDITLPRSFSRERVLNLEHYLQTGETFFLGIMRGDRLLGYYWAYISDFLFERTWHERSSYLSEAARGTGLGTLSKLMALEKAKEKGCTKAKSMYAPFNIPQQHIFERLGYKVSRIEVTANL